jgi:hypothetical protein
VSLLAKGFVPNPRKLELVELVAAASLAADNFL